MINVIKRLFWPFDDVKYIDYRNQSSSNDLSQLLTINCQMMSNIQTWEKIAVNEFQTIVKNNTEAFTVKAMEQQGDKLMAEIYQVVKGALVDFTEILI